MPIMQGDKKVANVYNINNNSYSVPIGCIIPFSGSTIPVGFLLCDGSEVSKTDYADLYAVIADLYGAATDTAKFKLPDLRDRFVQGANGNLGTTKEAGLPNITGKFYHDTNAKAGLSGAFTYESTGRQNLANDTPTNSGLIIFDASKSNAIYGNSDTVQPPSVCLSFIIKAEKISDQYAAEVGALIDDTSVSANKLWSSQKINAENKEVYSTDEVKTNKVWIDGKPIYRKVTTQTITTPEGTPINDFDTSLVDSVISIYGSIKQPSGNITPISFYNKTNDGAYVYTSKQTNRFILYAREIGVGDVILIVEYTKNTD